MNNVKLKPVVGMVVEYKGEYRVIVSLPKAGKIQLLDAAHGSAKVTINASNKELVLTKNLCKTITFVGAQYLVTKRGSIISIKTGRVMAWSADNGCRIKILAMAGVVEPV